MALKAKFFGGWMIMIILEGHVNVLQPSLYSTVPQRPQRTATTATVWPWMVTQIELAVRAGQPGRDMSGKKGDRIVLPSATFRASSIFPTRFQADNSTSLNLSQILFFKKELRRITTVKKKQMYNRQMRSIKHYRDILTVVVDISLQGTRCSSVLNSSISFPNRLG